LAFGTLTAACGDKVNILQPSTQVGVQSVTVTPSAASVTQGQTIQLSATVVADANTAKTVSWASSNTAVANVDATGKVSGVAAGSVTITATSTADNTKSAGAAVTVIGVAPPTAAAIAISGVNQGGLPANLAGVAGQVDVVLFVSGPSGVINLIQNCGTGDVIVAQQNFAGSQNQTPVTLSFNTAATGTVTNGVAVVNNTSNTPIFLNGPCTIKSSLTNGTTVLATANLTIPVTLANVSFFRTAMTTTGPSAISGNNGLNYVSGDVTFTLTPVNYVSATPLASISGTFGPATFTQVTPATGTQTFTVTFPSTIVTSGAAPALSNYTSPNAGDNLVVTGSVTTGGQNGFPAVATAYFGPVRVDNGIPTASAGSATNATGAQINNLTNWVNAAYTFSAGTVQPLDAGSPTTGTNTVTQVIGYAASTVASLTGNAVYGIPAGQGIGATQCSQTGWTAVTNGSTIPQSPAGVSTQYRARVFWTDKIGNVRCQDLVGNTTAGVPANANGFFGVDLQNPTLTQTAGPTGGAPTNTVAQNLANGKVASGTTISFAFQDSISGFVLNRQVNYSVFRNFTQTTASGSNGCSPINDGVNPVVTGTTATGCSNTANNGPNLNIDNSTNVEAYYTVIAKSVDQANNSSATQTKIYLIDATLPVVQGISIPQNLTGATQQTFTSTATDNVDLQQSNFNITYSAATTGATLFYAGDNYGPNYDATLVKSAAVNAAVPFFIKQLQATDAANAPVALTAADSGEAQQVTVRAIDAANNISTASVAAIPNINISSSAGFTTGTQFNTFQETNAAANVSNGTGTGAKTTSLTAAAILLSGTAQNANVPFAQVCFYYQQTAAGFAADATIPANALVQIGCVSAPSITDVAGVSRTWTYTLLGFDPPSALGTAGALPVFAVGINAAGVGILSQANNNITLIN